MLLNSEFMFFRLVPFLSAKKMSLLGVKVKGGGGNPTYQKVRCVNNWQ